MKLIITTLLLTVSLGVMADKTIDLKQPVNNPYKFNSNELIVAYGDPGQCIAYCASEHGICVANCQGDGQCIGNCSAVQGRCIANCN